MTTTRKDMTGVTSTQQHPQYGQGDIRQLQYGDLGQLTQKLQERTTDSRKPQYWWLNNRLLRFNSDSSVDNDISSDSETLSLNSSDTPNITPYPFTSTPSTESHVFYVWNRLFKYPERLNQAYVRIVETISSQDTKQKELCKWVSCAINAHACEDNKTQFLEIFESLNFLLEQFTTNSENGVTKREALHSVHLSYAISGKLEGMRCILDWINASPCNKSVDDSATLYRIFHTVLNGAHRSQRKAYGIATDSIELKKLSSTQDTDDFQDDFEQLIKSLVSVGADENEVRKFVEVIFALFNLMLVSCDEREGKLLLSGEKYLNKAASLLEIEPEALKNSLILSVKFRGTHKLTEGYRTAPDVNKARNKLITVLYNNCIGFFIEKFNNQMRTNETTKTVSLLSTPSVSYENPEKSSPSVASPANSPYGYSSFVRNFSIDFLSECYWENTEMNLTTLQRQERVQSIPSGKTPPVKPQLPLHQLTESGKKSESLIDLLLMGFGKKSAAKGLHQWIKKKSGDNAKIKINKKRPDVFSILLFGNSNLQIDFDCADVCNQTLAATHPEFTEIIRSSKSPIFSAIENSSYECVAEFSTLMQSLIKERTLTTQNDMFFIYCFSTSKAEFPLLHQFQVYRIPDIITKEDFCERLSHSAFITRYAPLALNFYTQPPEIGSSVNELIIRKIRLSNALVGMNYVFLNQQHIYRLDNMTRNFEHAILTLQCHYRRWNSYKQFKVLRKKAEDYKLQTGEVLIQSSSQLSEFQEFAKFSYYHDLERADTSLMRSLFENAQKQTPNQSTFWANLIVMENDRAVYITILQNDVTLVSGSEQQKNANHIALGKLKDSLYSYEAKQALENLEPGIILEIHPDFSITVEGNFSQETPSVWGHWMDFGRNFAGKLKLNAGKMENRIPTKLFLADDYARKIAESIITEEVDMDLLTLECLIPLVFVGHSTSLHDSPLWFLLVHYGPMEAIKTPEMQLQVRTMITNLVSLGDTKTSRAWSKIHCQRDLFGDETDLKTQLQMIVHKKNDKDFEADRRKLLKSLDSSRDHSEIADSSRKTWSREIHQKKLYYMKKK